ncbi:hypothetical protein JAAARDRAFT_200997 [Jaapia argillacea MUCL 33604]|uniref:Aminoglycoside phosphotransferase domain-containing protein n=1 Tax=Jaapia argillacea MUCL 33604 TaxID=933084 RepID=A0A067PFP0_9AGAM|nr:hypothetical protein JAAARDRAFT_200997 [Jaapia argillacea MUCL 33604]
MPDGSEFDGTQLLTLVRSGNSPFDGTWDVNLLIREIEENLGDQVIDIPTVYKGYNNYGFHLKLSNRPDVVARLARGDVNMPNYDGFPFHEQVTEVKFEVSVYELLRSEPKILASRLLYYRIPVQHVGPRLEIPQNIAGRRLLVFERAEGENNVWYNVNPEQEASLLAQYAHIRASLFNFNLPPEFTTLWLRERLFEPKPESFPVPVAPTHEFCIALFTSKIEATIKDLGETIGLEDNKSIVGPIAAAAKQSILRLIPHIMPSENDQTSLYRLVLDHYDFGFHNMSVTMDAHGQPLVTSLYDWETGCIVPAILSDPVLVVSVDLVTDENAGPSVTRVPEDGTLEDWEQYMMWSRVYFKALFDQAPDYERVIKAGKDARHLWFALREWRGDNPEGFFGGLGDWAERRMKELGVD